MAEFVVNYVLKRITQAAYEEARSLSGVRDKVERVKRDLIWISAFLKDADAKRNKDARVKQWVEEVKEVAYMIEDVLDKYFVEMGRGSWTSNLKRIGHFPKELIARHKLVSEIDKIKERMKEIKENTEKFGITSLENSSRDHPAQLKRPVEHPDIGKIEVIGFEDEFNSICRQLFDQSVSRRSVISIVGPGGRGKTTLAKKIYKSAEEKRHFNCLIWVTISKELEIVGILKKMLRKLREIDENEENRDEEHFLTELYKILRNKKYLIVLDDVWSTENNSESLWARLKNALPSDDNGSRVLITTRFINVATESDATSHPYHQLRILSEDESRQLLLKKVFPNQFTKECPVDLLPLINQFAKKCDGLALALVVLGGILSTKEPNYNTWDDFKMDWKNEGHECLDITSTSYEDLPSYLKPCFMYIALFPEDYTINASTLIQLWIAEGFIIHDEPTKATEETAQSYLEELVQRCMVQVSERSWSGRIKYCYIHDILHELAIHKAKEENFLLIFSESDANSASGSSTSARRIAFHRFGNSQLPKESIIGSKLRSLITFEEDFPNFQKLRMVRAIHSENLGGENCQWMKQLTTLRYFHSHCDIPDSFWNNKMLRYVKIENYRFANCVWGPSSSAKLKNLEILKGVRARDEWTIRFPHFPRIRKLGILLPYGTNWEAIANSIIKLENLESLFLLSGGLSHHVFIRAFKNYERMHSLYLYGEWPGWQIGDSSLFPPCLLKLTLRVSGLEQDPMQELEKLPNLRVLRLLYLSYDGEQLICSAGGFTRLQQLKLETLGNLKELKVEEGAMPLLKQLEISRCSKMVMLPDLQYLSKLEELKLKRMPQFDLLLEGPDRYKVEHIPSITISDEF